MSYVPSDFDNLNPGFNILNIYEDSTNLSSIEGGYTDKGLGYKQQYSLNGSLNNLLDPIDPHKSHITMDFCMIVKDDFTASSTCKLRTYIGDETAREQSQYISQEIDLVYVQPYTQMRDSNGNLVVLVEGFDLSAMDEIRDLTANSHFCMYVYQNTTIPYVNIASFDRNGMGSINVPTPDQQSLVLKWIQDINIINFSITRKSNISDIMEVSFNGTFDNNYLGTTNNTLTFMDIEYVNPRTYQSVSKTLVEGTDFTISGNTFYSGTGSSVDTIDIDLGEMFPEGINFTLFIVTNANFKSEIESTFENLPVFNWGKSGTTKYFNVNGELRINNELIELNDVYSTNEVKTNKIWIDGKPIYRKVLVGGSLAGGSSANISTGVNNIDSMLDTYGWGISSGGDWFPLSRAHSSTFGYQSTYYYYANGNRFEVETGANISYSSFYIIMEYTKTTD